MTAIDAALWLLAAPALVACAYLLALTAFSQRTPAPAAARGRRFDVFVPAHDEEQGIARTVRSLLAADYPASLRRVFVVADNCTDATAARAEAAGARVLVRTDPARRGKGYALAHAFDRSLADGFADAVVVIDADTVAPANLLTAFAARLERGAQAAQAGSGVLNARDSWRTQLMEVSLAVFNGMRSLAREHLGLSCGLRGNGMCLSTDLLRKSPWTAFSVVEDLEYGLALGRAGVRVSYAPEAKVRSAMTSSSKAAATQRRRWDLGRLRLSRTLALPLLAEGLRKRSAMLLDLAMDLLVPPLSFVALAVFAGLAISAALGSSALAAWGACAVCLIAYVARGWVVSGTGLRGLAALCRAPFFVLWKIAALLRPAAQGWARTPREEAAA